MEVFELFEIRKLKEYSDIEKLDLEKLDSPTLDAITTLMIEAASKAGFKVPPKKYGRLLPNLAQRELVKALLLNRNPKIESEFNLLLEIEAELYQGLRVSFQDVPDEQKVSRSETDAQLFNRIHSLRRDHLEKLAEHLDCSTYQLTTEIQNQIMAKPIAICAAAIRMHLPEIFIDPKALNECFSITDVATFICLVVADADPQFWKSFCCHLNIPYFDGQKAAPLLFAYEGVIGLEAASAAFNKALPSAAGFKRAA